MEYNLGKLIELRDSIRDYIKENKPSYNEYLNSLIDIGYTNKMLAELRDMISYCQVNYEVCPTSEHTKELFALVVDLVTPDKFKHIKKFNNCEYKMHDIHYKHNGRHICSNLADGYVRMKKLYESNMPDLTKIAPIIIPVELTIEEVPKLEDKNKITSTVKRNNYRTPLYEILIKVINNKSMSREELNTDEEIAQYISNIPASGTNHTILGRSLIKLIKDNKLTTVTIDGVEKYDIPNRQVVNILQIEPENKDAIKKSKTKTTVTSEDFEKYRERILKCGIRIDGEEPASISEIRKCLGLTNADRKIVKGWCEKLIKDKKMIVAPHSTSTNQHYLTIINEGDNQKN